MGGGAREARLCGVSAMGRSVCVCVCVCVCVRALGGGVGRGARVCCCLWWIARSACGAVIWANMFERMIPKCKRSIL